MQGHQYIFMIPACSCSRAFQAKEMAELNAPFVLPGEEIRVPLKAALRKNILFIQYIAIYCLQYIVL